MTIDDYKEIEDSYSFVDLDLLQQVNTPEDNPEWCEEDERTEWSGRLQQPLDEEDSIEQQCSFVLDIYTDLKMKTSLYHESMDIENPAEDLDEIGWNIFGIMESWNDFNDMMVARCKFIDRYLGKVIYGNPDLQSKTNGKLHSLRVTQQAFPTCASAPLRESWGRTSNR